MATIKKILVPTDFSKNASTVYSFVQRMAKNYDAQVDFIHVLSLRRYALAEKSEENIETLRRLLDEKLVAELNTHIVPENRGKAVVVSQKRPAKAIADAGLEGEYDVIVTAARGRHESLFNKGSVAEKLIRLSAIPVLSVNKGFYPNINTILMPTDGSKISMEALPWAVLIAAQNNAVIEMIGVAKYDGMMLRAVDDSFSVHSAAEIKKRVFKRLKDFVGNSNNKLKFVGEPSYEDNVPVEIVNQLNRPVKLSLTVVKGSSAHSSIVERANDKAEAVIMATHGRGGMASLFLGSTTEKVIRNLRLPVMTVRPKSLTKK